ncbi:MAG: cell envelope biogenesis protein OmpA [Pseudomonadota bacterium]
MRRMGTVILVAALVAGCGQGRTEKGVSGAAIGAGVGALGADYIGRDPLLGAILGGLGGAALGVRLGRDDRRRRYRGKRRYRDYDDDDD